MARRIWAQVCRALSRRAMQLAGAGVKTMPTHRPRGPTGGACGRRMPCAADALVPAAPVPQPGTRRGPVRLQNILWLRNANSHMTTGVVPSSSRIWWLRGRTGGSPTDVVKTPS
jgi:hypothetical protein